METDALHRFIVHDLQLVALTILVVLYAVKVWQLSRLPVPRELPPARGNVTRSVVSSYASILSPASMESTRQRWGHWLAFITYHIGILVAITATFTIPFWPAVMTPAVRWSSAVLIALAFGAGAFKLGWRLARPEMRYISTPDDYFSLVVLEIWFVLAVPAILWEPRGWLLAYFGLTAALLVYVPLSKISHYIYWFFSRYIFGVRYGRRGVL